MNQLNQANKEAVWDLWQRLNYATSDQVPDLLRAALHDDVNWNVSAPIDQIMGVDAVIADFWLPLLDSFPDLKRAPYVFMGGIDESSQLYATAGGEEWVSGCGYLTGTFVKDWLGIPATHKKTNIFFGVFYVLREGKVAETYLQLDILAVMRQAGYQALPPAPGAEGGKIPAPLAKDGILLTEQDALESRKSVQLVQAMGKGMRRYVRSRDGGDLRSMEQDKYWHPDMKWYGPSGIGACFSKEEYEDFHQRPWLEGFGDRNISREGSGRRMGRIGEGPYCAGGIWDTAYSHHNGAYVGMPASGKLLTLRDFDWWKREGEYLIENWVPIDMIDLFRQMDVDLMERLRQQIEARKRGAEWL
ncbi:MAG: ester cyclase [Anaerolineae bacterium]|nr:ester cyclase [Anaerolineae bacterium]